MTQAEAELFAKNFFGDSGFADVDKSGNFAETPYIIGMRISTVIGEEGKACIGLGKSWEAAIREIHRIYKDDYPRTYMQNPKTTAPANKKALLRRYMSIDKFRRIAESNTLWFARADQLGDPFEGSIPRANLRNRSSEYAEQREFFNRLGTQIKKSAFDYYMERSKTFYRARLSMFVSCWQVNNFEDSSMWRAYIPDNRGIAIETNFTFLKDSFTSKFHPSVTAGMVNYVDFDKEEIDTSDFYNIILTKRKEFQADRELRAILFMPQYTNLPIANIPLGIPVEINFKRLIKRIIVNPNASPDLFQEVAELCLQYGLPEPSKSSLSGRPNY